MTQLGRNAPIICVFLVYSESFWRMVFLSIPRISAALVLLLLVLFKTFLIYCFSMSFSGINFSLGNSILNFRDWGRCSISIILSHIITARWMTFSNSLILPGQS